MALQDKIGREEIVDKICGLVGSLKKDKNFCLAINGAWGSGKSFVLGLIEEKLSKRQEYIIIKYDAWENTFYSDPLIAILSCFLDGLEDKLSKMKGYGKVATDFGKKKGKEIVDKLSESGGKIGFIAKIIKEIFEVIPDLKNVSLVTDTKNNQLEIFKSYKSLAECTHEYTEEVVEGTCTTKGYTRYTCTLCGDTYTDNYTDVNGHKFGEIVIEPTCTHRGYTIHYCEGCGYEYSDSYVPATGHAYEAEEHPVTCTENGYTVYTCKNCGDEYTVDGEEAIGHDYEEKTVGRTCESYGYTVHTCKNCADRYVTDYVKPAGHDYEKTVVKAEEGKVGYTKYTCKECDYNYVSDFVTSGDDGYIEENPDTPIEPEQPDKPTEPDQPENPAQPEQPDKPENPDEHTHVYVFDAVVREQEKTMTVSYVCECGDNRTEFVKVEFTSADDGSGVVLIPGENGELDFAVLEGKYIVTVTNDNGEELMVYEVNLAKNEPVKPEQPDKPTEPETPDKPDDDKPSDEKPNEDKPSEPETPDTPSDSETDKPSDTEKEEKKTSAAVILLPILLVLGAGAVVTLVVLKKKNGKNKKSENKKEQK